MRSMIWMKITKINKYVLHKRVLPFVYQSYSLHRKCENVQRRGQNIHRFLKSRLLAKACIKKKSEFVHRKRAKSLNRLLFDLRLPSWRQQTLPTPTPPNPIQLPHLWMDLIGQAREPSHQHAREGPAEQTGGPWLSNSRFHQCIGPGVLGGREGRLCITMRDDSSGRGGNSWNLHWWMLREAEVVMVVVVVGGRGEVVLKRTWGRTGGPWPTSGRWEELDSNNNVLIIGPSGDLYRRTMFQPLNPTEPREPWYTIIIWTYNCWFNCHHYEVDGKPQTESQMQW